MHIYLYIVFSGKTWSNNLLSRHHIAIHLRTQIQLIKTLLIAATDQAQREASKLVPPVQQDIWPTLVAANTFVTEKEAAEHSNSPTNGSFQINKEYGGLLRARAPT